MSETSSNESTKPVVEGDEDDLQLDFVSLPDQVMPSHDYVVPHDSEKTPTPRSDSSAELPTRRSQLNPDNEYML